MRLDKYLLLNNYFNSRNKAHMAILNKAIFVNDKLVTKPSYDVLESDIITIKNENILPYVSRGGLKLEGAINSFNLDFKDKTVLDIGASTGGFTDCALKHGAKLVYAVDVGHDQLATELKNDKKVLSLEDTNILSLPTFPEKIDIVLLDCSFVSITNLLDALVYYLNENNYLIVLIKPQFEVGHIYLKNGVVKDKKLIIKVLEKIEKALNSISLYINNITKSIIKGSTGNQEYLAYVSKKETKKIDFSSII